MTNAQQSQRAEGEALRERVARAIFTAGAGDALAWEDTTVDYHEACFVAANAAIVACREAMVPKWMPIKTAPRDDEWISRCLFGIWRPWGWEMWVGQCDDGDLWLGRMGNGSCFKTEPPTHWMPLPEPPEPQP